jgi:hypothetical protein
MKQAVHVACTEDRRGHRRFWWVDLMERNHFEDLGIEGRIILKWILKKCDGEAWTGLLWPRDTLAVMNLQVP